MMAFCTKIQKKNHKETLFFKLLLLILFETKFWNLFTIQEYLVNQVEIKLMRLQEKILLAGMANIGVNVIFCARIKSGPGFGKSPLHLSLLQFTRPLDRIAIYIKGGLPKSRNRNEYIIIVGDYFSKWKEAYMLFQIIQLTLLLLNLLLNSSHVLAFQIQIPKMNYFHNFVNFGVLKRLELNFYRPQSD